MTVLWAAALATLPILPLVVFLAETCVVTLCTVRTICIARGRKTLAATLGFFEVSIWLFAIGQVMQNLSRPDCYLAFATGFSLGNFLGIVLEKKLALGNLVVHITTQKDPSILIDRLRAANYGVTALDARGATGPVQVLFTVIPRRELRNVVAIIESFDRLAFYSVNDLQAAAQGISPSARERPQSAIPGPLRVFLPSANLSGYAADRPVAASRHQGEEMDIPASSEWTAVS